MTTDELRIAVAKSLGAGYVAMVYDGQHMFWMSMNATDIKELPEGTDMKFVSYKDMPLFTTSLDACREGWEKDVSLEYWYLLFELVNGVNPGQLKLTMTLDKCWIAVCRATAEQRCRAFLKWKGKVI